MITELIKKLEGHLPTDIYNQLPGILVFGIDGPLRLSHLLGQTKYESGNYQHMVENLNYSGDALWTMFHTHFKDRNEAESYGHQQERIAARLYANRMGNGDEASSDGWKFRGRGALQLTGRHNYQLLGSYVGEDLTLNPDLVATTYALASAAFFFKSNGLWPICDKGVDYATVTSVTAHVNGGSSHLQDRYTYTQEFHNLLTA